MFRYINILESICLTHTTIKSKIDNSYHSKQVSIYNFVLPVIKPINSANGIINVKQSAKNTRFTFNIQ